LQQFFKESLKKPVDTLRVLLVGSPERLQTVTAALIHAGHDVIPVDRVEHAAEALLIQRFDAVLLGGLSPNQVLTFSTQVRDLERKSGAASRTAVLSLVPADLTAPEPVRGTGIDGYVPDSADPDTLTLAIARLASAVGTESVDASPLGDELPVLDVEQLKEQVAYDDELLVELIDLFLSERIRQVIEMRQAFQSGDFEQLSRVAHTIKGSLSSLHALAAKANAQALELCSKEQDAPRCQGYLAALEQDLDRLEGQLLNVRKSVSPS
jgi:HPt (histidine-containing phosphotransfer) domain-containing protein